MSPTPPGSSQPKVDCVAETSVCSEAAVQAYPTIKLYSGGKDEVGTEYTGGRSADALAHYVSEQNAMFQTEQDIADASVTFDGNVVVLTDGNFAAVTETGHSMVNQTRTNATVCCTCALTCRL